MAGIKKNPFGPKPKRRAYGRQERWRDEVVQKVTVGTLISLIILVVGESPGMKPWPIAAGLPKRLRAIGMETPEPLKALLMHRGRDLAKPWSIAVA